MKRGKQTCRILKEIRKQIAEANDIEFITSECQYQGDCLGTCPKCESEVRYLEQQLEYKRIAGKAITIFGLSAGIMATIPLASCTSSTNKGSNQDVVTDTLQAANSDTICPTNQMEALTPTDSTTCAPSEKQISTQGFSDPQKTSKKEKVTISLAGGVGDENTENIIEEKKISENDTLDIAEQMPTFPGGRTKLMEFLTTHIKYPEIAQGDGTHGRVIVQFVVDKDGSILNPRVLRGVDPYLDKEAIRIVKLMPKWIPGVQDGKNVMVRFTVPVTFRIQ